MSMTGELIRVEDQLDQYFDALAEATTDEQRTQIELALRGAVQEHASRVDSIVNWFERGDREIDYLQRREVEIKDAQDRWERKQKTVRQILAAHLDMTGQTKLPGRETKGITFVKGSLRVEILDSNYIPAKFKTVKVVETINIDKRAIKDALDNFEDVPGAALVEGPPTVRVK
jgi:predicted transcriptional regulator